MEIKSVFEDGERIPVRYTCDGDNINPPLEFLNVPSNARSLLLIVDDPDSPSKIWLHWMLWNIRPDRREIEEDTVPDEAEEGENDFGECGYGGPCPHSGVHKYQFKLYALDTLLNLSSGSTKKDIETVMMRHIIDKAVLVGLYSRKSNN
ncbi:MAG: YbhB/YbcL family Raf kinase inhibitor-like protein [Candidatus Nanoarchaeia archaeon]